MEMVDREEGTRQGTHLETLLIRNTMELDTQLIRQTSHVHIRIRIQKAAGMMAMIGITDAFAFMFMLRRRVKSLALR